MKKIVELRQPSTWTTKQVLCRQLQERPAEVAVQFVDGIEWNYSELDQQARSVAAGLQTLGLAPGEKVAAMLLNGPEYLSLWCGAHYAGLVLVGLNTELLGEFLRHAIALSDAKVLVINACFVPRLNSLRCLAPQLEQIILVGDEDTVCDLPFNRHAYDVLQSDPLNYVEFDAAYTDLAALIYTSGTTGPSKAVMMPHAHCYLYGLGTIEHGELTADDSYYITMPLFHANGLFMQLYACLIRGTKAVIRQKFSASSWLSDIREYGITHTNLLGVMTDFIAQQPAGQNDQCHQLRTVFAAPAIPSLIGQFNQRFGIQDVRELYGMSEVNIPLYNSKKAPVAGSCGRVYEDFFEVRIAHPVSDEPLPSGAVGEIQVRPKQAAGFMSGYYKMPDKTVEAWRNLWFHTGDAGLCDSNGNFYFKDRIKDSIRRRGENISSYEVESILLAYPGVIECAVIAVPSDIPGGEDEVMAVVSSEEGTIDVDGLIDFAVDNMPKFAVPRYYRQLPTSEFPRTATNKIRKQPLRDTGITADTWDVECKGFVQRDRY